MVVDIPEEPSYFLVLGPSGSGLTTALNTFNDYGFMIVSNVQPNAFETVFDTLLAQKSQKSKVVFSIDLTPQTLDQLPEFIDSIRRLKSRHPHFKILCLDAPEPVLMSRYMDSGKTHRFEQVGLQAAVAEERQVYNNLKKELKDFSIDTSTVSSEELRFKIAKILGIPENSPDFSVYILSFGYKYGIPLDSELVFDMRFMQNPFYDESLRPYTGLDQPIRDYIFALPQAREFFEKWTALMAVMLPWYQKEGKARVTIAVGCTGGQHRSVCMAEALAGYLKSACPTYNIMVNHRETFRWPKTAQENSGLTSVKENTMPVGESF